jgi:hypothetical protein
MRPDRTAPILKSPKAWALVNCAQSIQKSSKHRTDSSSEGNTRAVSSMFRVGRFVQQGVENLVGRCVVVALARP